MNSFVSRIDAVQRGAQALAKACPTLTDAAKKTAVAAEAGDIARLRKALGLLTTTWSSIEQLVHQATEAWTHNQSDEETLLSEYEAGLREAVAAAGFKVFKNDRDLIAYPFILRFLAKDRALLIDGEKTTNLRPERVVELLREKRARIRPATNERFLQTLYSTYRVVCGKQRLGQPVLLDEIYSALTLFPGTAAAYSESEFVRDLYLLDREGPRTTKNGASLSLPASTGTKNRSGLFSFLGPEGERVDYYAIQFREQQHEFGDQI